MISRWMAAWRSGRLQHAAERLAARLPGTRWLVLIAGAVLIFTLVLRYLLIEPTNVNWDEFNFLRSVYLTANGEQTRVLQTVHGHLFSWLRWLPGHELDQILAARRVMFLLAVISAALLGWIGKRLFGGGAGLFAAFVYGSFAYVLHHGTAFRYDSIIVPCYLGVAALLLAAGRPRLTAALAGLLGAAALIISIKSIFLLLPLGAVAALAVIEPSNRRRHLVRLVTFVVSGVLSFAALYALHSLAIADVAGATGATVARAGERVILFDTPFPNGRYWLASIRWDTWQWLLLLGGLVIVGGDLLHRRDLPGQIRRLQVLALALPLATLYFYRNQYPYYYVTILPGACLVAGCLWRRIELLERRPVLAWALAALVAFPAARSAWLWFDHNNKDETRVQRGVIESIHEMFPEPVAYIDRCGMISSFEKVGPFMSTWVMGDYRKRGVDVFPQLLREKQPRFVLVNSPTLDLRRPFSRVKGPYRWRRGDYEQLQENFVHHWGPIWLIGKSLEVEPGAPREFEIFLSGRYKLEAKGPTEIDGRVYQPGTEIDFSTGTHTLTASHPESQTVILRWGASLPRPPRRPVDEVTFRGFGLRAPPR